MTGQISYHRPYLEKCLDEAQKSLDEKCTPVAALLVNKSGDILFVTRSQAVSDEDDRQGAILHAELKLLLNNQHLFNNGDIRLYASMEPCLMCMGAIIVSRVSLVVWAVDDYWGGALQVYNRNREYIRQRLPRLIRTPFSDLQIRGARMWIEHLNRVGHPEYIERILKWQSRLV